MIPFVNIHTHIHIDNKEFIEIVNIDIDDIASADVSYLYSVGIHPWKAQDTTEVLKCSNLKSSNFLAIGECGLDRVNGNDLESQKNVFIKHINLSEQYKKPLIIHCVRAYPDIIEIKKETRAKSPWIVHGFQGNEQSVMQLLKHDIYISLGDVLFKDENKASALLRIIPSDKLFLETDVSERNIIDVYEKASLLSGVEMNKLRNDIFDNFVKIFGQI